MDFGGRSDKGGVSGGDNDCTTGGGDGLGGVGTSLDGVEIRAGAYLAAGEAEQWEGTVVRVRCVVGSDVDRACGGADEER